jgi:hypothetical protein
MAYLTDSLLLGAVLLLLGLVRELVFQISEDSIERFLEVGWQDFVLTVLYFGLFEGILGWTPGKKLLRLRVSRVGQTGPPGIWRALLRALVFNTIFYAIFVVPQWSVLLAVRGMGPLLAATSFIVGLLLLFRQLWQSPDGWRGVHDFVSGCRVIQRSRPGYRLRLVSRQPDPLARIQPSPTPLPAFVGGFGVTGKLCDLPDGGEVWIGEDQSLGRRMLIRLLPPGREDPIEGEVPVTRPTRLRVVGHGTLAWNGRERSWTASVAPAGAPLVDVAGPDRRLTWAETRPVLEQLAAELAAAEADGSGVLQPGVDQVWVEPGGRVQLVDFPIPCGPAPSQQSAPDRPARNALDYVRQVATLALEGQPRSQGGGVKAPLPPHASHILNKLFDSGYRTAAQLHTDLVENASHPPLVTASLRAAHLSAQGALLATGLIFMFIMSGLFNYMSAFIAAQAVHQSEQILVLVRDPTTRETLLTRARSDRESGALSPTVADRLTTALSPEKLAQTQALLEKELQFRRDYLDQRRGYLTRPELTFLAHTVTLNEAEGFDAEPPSPAFVDATIQMTTDDKVLKFLEAFNWALAGTCTAGILSCVAIWLVFAFAFHGGVSMNLAGLTLVRGHGVPAGRFRCTIRELLVWTPIVILLLLSLWTQALAPERVFLRTTLWLTALLLLPAYVMLALRDPPRPPHDRIMDTHIVPV